MKKVFLLAAAALMLLACKNDQNAPDQPQPMTQEQAVQTYFMNPVVLNGTFIETGNAMLYAAGRQKAPARVKSEGEVYPIITWTPQNGTWPIDLTVDYGTEGVIAADGLEHSGKMEIHATARFEEEGSVLTPKFTDFHVYGNVLTASQVIKNMGKNEAGNLVFDVTVEDGLLGAQKELIYSEHTSREMIDGLQENGWLNPDVTTHTYSITGWMKTESKIDTIPGYTVTIDAEDPMVIAVGDLYPTAGNVQIALDKELSYTWQGMTVKFKSLEIEFTGEENGQYGAIMSIDYKIGPVSQTLQLSFKLDEKGIVKESITPLLEQ